MTSMLDRFLNCDFAGCLPRAILLEYLPDAEALNCVNYSDELYPQAIEGMREIDTQGGRSPPRHLRQKYSPQFGPEQLARCDYEIAIVKGFGEALVRAPLLPLLKSMLTDENRDMIKLKVFHRIQNFIKDFMGLWRSRQIWPRSCIFNRCESGWSLDYMPEDKTPPSRALRTLKIQPRNPLSRCQSYPHRHDITSLSARCALLSGAAAVYHVESSFHSGEMVMGINMMIDAAISESQKPGNVFKHFGFSSVLGTQHRNLMQHDLESRVEECLFLTGGSI
ncbi:hypothetical protein I7I51_08281, partial [Histoplasma capsulatum]